MYIENKESYKNLILNKAELEHWEIITESESDKKLFDMFFGEPIKQKKQNKKMSMESILFIIFGRNAVDSLLNEGFKTHKKSNK